jgi:signal transduction histidine kinase
MPRPKTKNAFDQALLALARINVDAGHSVREAIHTVARVAVNALGVDRFSVWLSTGEGDAVRLYFLYRKGGGAVMDGTILRVEQFPKYFAALRDSRALLVPNVETEPAVSELLPAYLKPLGITALLDAPIYRAGVLVGVVCHEHIGVPRIWEASEREFAADVAAAVARLFEEGGRVQAEDSLKMYQQHLRELSRYEGMGRLAAGVAHDLRNLLHVVDANAELAMERVHDPEVLESLQAVRDAAARSRDLASTVLQFGSNQVEGPVVIDPAELLRECELLLRGALAPSQQLVLREGPTGRRIFAPRAELERMLLNLVTNAREAMPDGGTVTVSIVDLETGSDGAGEVVIEVRDDGMGMTPDVLAMVRRPFYTTKARGTGLGLSMADQVLARAGGALQIDSVAGEGTTVRCVLPRIA